MTSEHRDTGVDVQWHPPRGTGHGLTPGASSSTLSSKRRQLDAPSVRDPFPYSTDGPPARGIWAWLRGDRVMIWVVALLIGQAIARIVAALMEDVLEPIFNRAFNDPDNEHPTVSIFGAKIRVRHFLVALFQFLFIVIIAYAFSNRGAYDPAFFKPHDT